MLTSEESSMYQTDLELFRTVRIATLGLAAELTDQQAAFSPGPDRWSIGEVLDHILLAEQLYRAWSIIGNKPYHR